MNVKDESLNLKYVSEVINNDWMTWKPGDVITLQSQTGTGKTLFITGNKSIRGLIDFIPSNKRLIYLCNRSALKRQIKIDLLIKFNLEIDIPYKVNKRGQEMIDFEKLDKIVVIRNIVISSYHSLAENEKDIMYLEEGISNLDEYDYIICDEAHFILTDSNFNTKTNFVYRKLIREKYSNSVVIFISATLEEILPEIEKAFEDNQSHNDRTASLHQYSTGIDYSYLNVKYFRSEEDVVKLIRNDKTDEKWIIFVTAKDMGLKLKEELRNYGIHSVFVHSGSKGKEVEGIINYGKFECKVLISTKFLDNGVNIKDDKVKNLVVCAYDRTTFIQEIGRIRINIKAPQVLNLYIKAMNRNVFQSMVKKVYSPKIRDVELLQNEPLIFASKYSTSLHKVKSDIIYRGIGGNFEINETGYARLKKDYEFALRVIEAFKVDRFAFVKEQLSWLELEDTFDQKNLLEKVVDNEAIKQIKDHLDSIEGKRLFKEEKKKLIDVIGLKDSRGREQKSISVLNAYLIENYGKTIVSKTTKDRNRNNIRFWQVESLPVPQNLE